MHFIHDYDGGIGSNNDGDDIYAIMTDLQSSPTAMTPEDLSERIDTFSFPLPASGSSTSLSTSPSSASTAQSSRTRRQPAYYPNVNSTNKLQKPFSRSAAKRESVMALGSIEHLQHYFTKAGIAAKQEYVAMLVDYLSYV